MTSKLTITRERMEEIILDNSASLEEIILDNSASLEEFMAITRMALAAMVSEPHTDDELSNLLWFSQEATCHSDPNYFCEFQRLASPRLIAGIIRELQERRRAERDNEPYGFTDGDRRGMIYEPQFADRLNNPLPVYRHAQPAPECQHQWRHGGANKLQDQKQCIKCGRVELDAQPAPVVPDEKPMPNPLRMHAVDAVATIAEVKGWNACRAAMLQAGNSPVIPDGYRLQPISEYEAMCATVNSDEWPQRWIPVSERMPVDFEAVIAFDGDQVYGEAVYSSGDGFTIDGYDPCDRVQLQNVSHWMPLPAAPQEVNHER